MRRIVAHQVERHDRDVVRHALIVLYVIAQQRFGAEAHVLEHLERGALIGRQPHGQLGKTPIARGREAMFGQHPAQPRAASFGQQQQPHFADMARPAQFVAHQRGAAHDRT